MSELSKVNPFRDSRNKKKNYKIQFPRRSHPTDREREITTEIASRNNSDRTTNSRETQLFSTCVNLVRNHRDNLRLSFLVRSRNSVRLRHNRSFHFYLDSRSVVIKDITRRNPENRKTIELAEREREREREREIVLTREPIGWFPRSIVSPSRFKPLGTA